MSSSTTSFIQTGSDLKSQKFLQIMEFLPLEVVLKIVMITINQFDLHTLVSLLGKTTAIDQIISTAFVTATEYQFEQFESLSESQLSKLIQFMVSKNLKFRTIHASSFQATTTALWSKLANFCQHYTLEGQSDSCVFYDTESSLVESWCHKVSAIKFNFNYSLSLDYEKLKVPQDFSKFNNLKQISISAYLHHDSISRIKELLWQFNNRAVDFKFDILVSYAEKWSDYWSRLMNDLKEYGIENPNSTIQFKFEYGFNKGDVQSIEPIQSTITRMRYIMGRDESPSIQWLDGFNQLEEFSLKLDAQLDYDLKFQNSTIKKMDITGSHDSHTLDLTHMTKLQELNLSNLSIDNILFPTSIHTLNLDGCSFYAGPLTLPSNLHHLKVLSGSLPLFENISQLTRLDSIEVSKFSSMNRFKQLVSQLPSCLMAFHVGLTSWQRVDSHQFQQQHDEQSQQQQSEFFKFNNGQFEVVLGTSVNDDDELNCIQKDLALHCRLLSTVNRRDLSLENFNGVLSQLKPEFLEVNSKRISTLV
ncbi:unnamed protein product [Ambrosiozyma monospora]|uniref:Unnamed protein product n=1 Tax=Ambrosiozyma monospora TaxID=43982 RepID=A0ACB5T6U8_AMBMO|nr:unnamed protein product [Ambrosiozyma monospora]